MDPDVIMVGELRDIETIDACIKAAETGHLVLSTLHTQNAASTINRLIGHYPPDAQDVIRHRLADVLVATISLRLTKDKSVVTHPFFSSPLCPDPDNNPRAITESGPSRSPVPL